ncbi:WD40-repeat-containing domain protein [Mycena rosella]|uniref:WD40-repeat-containing domain protein n=1 Tax=Mycena rosella TaxID=1033263 RepID=A0AAD7DPG3_MYCRO|nr:WD40-repeat-containing domain protein [Mycena rosella]
MERDIGSVFSVAFSPDSMCVVSGSHDETVRIWDVATGAEVTKMEGHSDSVLSVAFSPDGTRVVSGSDDETVRIWDATTGAEVDNIHLWICQSDGWMVSRQHPHHRLFWYPPDLQHTVPVSPCLCLISTMGQTRLEFHTRTLGADWQQIYHSPRTYIPPYYVACSVANQ